MMDDAHIAELFWRAAYGQEPWERAIDAIGAPLHARTGQIAAITPDGTIKFSLMSRASHTDVAEFISHNAHLPTVNPRISKTLQSPIGQCVDDNDFLDADAKQRLDVYRNFFLPTGTSNSLTVRLQGAPCSSDALVCAVMRPETLGPASEAERRFLERISLSISGAIEMAIHFGRLETDAMVAALASEGRAVIALGLGGRIVALSDSAERMLRQGLHLTQRHGRLRAAHPHSATRFEAALNDIGASDALHRGRRFVAVSSARDAAPPIIAAFNPVPVRTSGSFSSTVALLTIAEDRLPEGCQDAFGDAYELTEAESWIALALAQGHSLQAIARLRSVSLGTVRNQLKSIMLKTGTQRQSELASLFLRLSP